jgi:autotransporter-associated beta strand protein
MYKGNNFFCTNKSLSVFASLISLFSMQYLSSATISVTNTNGGNVLGSFANAIINSSSDDTIDCSPISGGIITLTASLPAITHSLTISGSGVSIDGDSNTYQALSIAEGTVTLDDLTIQNAITKGGSGGSVSSGGGGGGGAVGGGGAIYVHTGSHVILSSVGLNNNIAKGGDGGTEVPSGCNGGPGGGGGFGGGDGNVNGCSGGGGGHAGGGTGGRFRVVGADGIFFGGAGGGGYQAEGGNSSLISGGFTGGASSSNSGGGGAGIGGNGGDAVDGTGGVGGIGIGTDNAFGAGGGGFGYPTSGGNGTGAGGGGGGFIGLGGNGGALGGGGGGSNISGQGGNGGFGAGGGAGGVNGTGGLGGTLGGDAGITGVSAGGGAALGGGIFIQSDATLTIQDGVSFSGNSLIAGTAGAGTPQGSPGQALGLDIFLRSGGTLEVNINDSDLLISTDITSDQGGGGGTGGGLIKRGNKKLTLTGENNFTGGISILVGILEGSTLSLPGNIVDNASLIFDQNVDGTFANIISGSGTVEKTGSSKLTLSGDNTFTGNLTITEGSVQAPASSLPGNIVDNASLIFDQNVDGTFANIISGSGTVEKTGISKLTLSGDNTFTGNLTITEGSVQAPASSLPGNIVDNASLIFDQNADGTFVNIISGSGTVEKTGSSTLVLSGDSTFTGPTLVTEGTLVVSGSLTSNVIVSSGATLKGCGSGVGSVISSGVIYPGCSVGVLSLTDLTLDCGASLTIEADAAGISSILASGEVTIEPGCVDLNFLVGNGFNGIFENITILNAAGGITGEFNSVSINNSLLQVRSLRYNNNSISMNIELSNFGGLLSSSNARNVGDAIIEIVNDGNTSFNSIVTSLIDLPNITAVDSALNEMQPAQFKGLAVSQESNVVRVQNTLGYRFEQVLNEVHCYRVNSNTDSRTDENYECDSDRKTFHTWLDGYGDLLYQQGILIKKTCHFFALNSSNYLM